VSKKFFTLIYGDQIRTAPTSKILPSDSFSQLLEASEVLDHVKKDAEKYREQVVKECEQLKEQAQLEGYEEGLRQWTEHLLRLENETKRVHQELQQLVIPVALKAARKMIGRELELSEAVIVDIVSSTLRTVAQHKRVTIYVNKKDIDILEKNRQKLKDLFENLESFSVRPRDDVAPGGCIIETEIGIINAQLEHRWHILEKAFEALIKNPESSKG
jgi:type III secretion protein L